MNKLVVTMNINDYAPAITKLTMPYMKRYAKRIGADFHVISERLRPEYNIDYEKFQLWDLSKDYDYTLFFDADALILPGFYDLTTKYGENEVFNPCPDVASTRFLVDNYFRRDGRDIGVGAWCVCCTNRTRDIWHPTKLTQSEINERITPNLVEQNFGYESEHFICDYLCSRNVAKYGLKVKTFNDVVRPEFNKLLVHVYLDNLYRKEVFLRETIKVSKKFSKSVFAKNNVLADDIDEQLSKKVPEFKIKLF